MRQLVSVWLGPKGEAIQCNVSTYEDNGQLDAMSTWTPTRTSRVEAYLEALDAADKVWWQQKLETDGL